MYLRYSDICSKRVSPYSKSIFDWVEKKNNAFVV